MFNLFKLLEGYLLCTISMNPYVEDNEKLVVVKE